jgi:hypothetical protein
MISTLKFLILTFLAISGHAHVRGRYERWPNGTRRANFASNTPKLVYYGGPLNLKPKTFVIYYGSKTGYQKEMTNFYKYVPNSSYFMTIGKYNVTKFKIIIIIFL